MNQRPLLYMATGPLIIGLLFLAYSRYQDPELITPAAVDPVVRLAVGFYVVMILAWGLAGYGGYLYHKRAAASGGSGIVQSLARITWGGRPRRVFVITFIVYGVFFSLTSGTLVYQPEVDFGYHYGVPVPSIQISPCCDAPGYRPLILVYMTDHVGLQIIPINLALQIAVSYLVGLNAAIAAAAVSISRTRRGMGTIGAATGLFIACPTCVGSLFSIILGAAGGIALSVAVAQLQTVFIAVSIPVLLLTPFLMGRRIRDAYGASSS